MNHRYWVGGLAVAALCGCATAQERAEVPGWLAKDFDTFVQNFDGRWDNDRHVFFAEDADMQTDEIAPRQHIQIKSMHADDAPPNTAMFTATRSVDGEAPLDLIHTLVINLERQTIRQTFAVPGGTPLDCAIDWRREGAQFRGTASGEGCSQMFPRPADGGALAVTLAKSDDEFWVTSRRGDAVIEARLRRARPFECWTAILRGARHGDSGEGMQDWDFRRGVTLHDQGGEAELMTDEETPRRIRLRLRNVDWPYGTNRPSLTLYVLEGDSDRAVSYAWNEGNAERIGINLRWIQASCTHTPDE